MEINYRGFGLIGELLMEISEEIYSHVEYIMIISFDPNID